jgi:hypothetical protein
MKFWKLLTDAKFTGRPSQLTEDDVWQMGRDLGLFDGEIDPAIRGLREFKNQDG